MARTFDGASTITTSLGALGFAFGPGSTAWIVRTNSALATAYNIFSAGASATVGWEIRINASAKLIPVFNGTGATAGATTLSVSTWYLLGFSKATGTVTPRLHIYDFGANTWVHENAGSTAANPSVPLTSAIIGARASAANKFVGDIAVGGAWNVVLADQDFESLAFSLPPWFAAAQPKDLIVLDQAATTQNVPDISGGGANQSAITGTAVSTNSVPVWTPYGTVTNP